MCSLFFILREVLKLWSFLMLKFSLLVFPGDAWEEVLLTRSKVSSLQDEKEPAENGVLFLFL